MNRSRGGEARSAVISTITGDRVCASCGFNMVGQPVVREEHYGMLMARCPECATPAALQEYPVYSRWRTRLSGLLAAVMVMLFLGLAAGTTLIGTAFTVAGSVEMSQRYSRQISALQAEWFGGLSENERRAQYEATGGLWGGSFEAFTTSLESERSPFVLVEWWENDGIGRIQGKDVGVRAMLSREVLWLMLMAAVVMGVLAAGWATLLLGVRRRWLAVVAVPVAGAIAVVSSFMLMLDVAPGLAAFRPAQHVAAEVMGTRAVAVMVLVAMAGFVAGLLAGRTLARVVVCAVLPPRLRGGLGALWLADGLPMPTARSQRLVKD